MRLKLALAAALLAPASARAHPEDEWRTDSTRHFSFHRESPGSALGDYNLVERVYESLHREFWPLTPWMTDGTIGVYLYKDVDSYRRGRFMPPPWSGGMYLPLDRQLVVFEPIAPGVVAHELSHLYLHAYFAEKRVRPPAWLDEGLAMILEQEALSLPDPRLKGPILREPIPFRHFLWARPDADAPSGRVSAWYRQAQSVVWFVKRGNPEGRFPDLCARLRDGESADSALRAVYGFQTLDEFEAAWLRWRPTKPAGALKGLGDQ